MDPFPFIVGYGRSGTTLLRAMFDSHPALAVPYESSFIVPLGWRRRRYEDPRGFRVDRFVADLAAQRGFARWGLGEEVVLSALSAAPPSDYAEAVRRVYGTYAAARGKQRYGDKTPMYVSHLPLLASLFPEARFIHLIRDGRDVALSFLDQDFGPRRLEGAALGWRGAVRTGRRRGRRLGTERYVEVRYEALVADPEATLRPLCSFVGLSFDPGMLRYHEHTDELLVDEEHRRRHRNLERPLTPGLRDWRRHMSAGQAATFQALAGDTLAELGYDPGPRPSAAVRLAAWRSAARLRAGRARSALRGRLARMSARMAPDAPGAGRSRARAR